jgi:hypothetical protein
VTEIATAQVGQRVRVRAAPAGAHEVANNR